MSDTGKQSPLGTNVLSSLLTNVGFYINPIAQGYMGVSKTYTQYTFGAIVNNSCLNKLTYAINDAYTRGLVDDTTYNNLISIGSDTIPALGNSPSASFNWTGPANNGSPDSTKRASWLPYTATGNKAVTQWGYVRLFALQAWNEFNWNGLYAGTVPAYKDFCSSFISSYSFIEYSNQSINTLNNAKTFLKGTYSNMNDLTTADISGVSLSTQLFGQDLLNSGKAINLAKILTFGLPSNLLQTLKEYNAFTSSLSVALLSSGLTAAEIESISTDAVTVTAAQEQKLYGAFLIIIGVDLTDILIPINCKTENLESLADLLNVKKLFPNSYLTLTVPLYNSNPGPTNSKTYYPIFDLSVANPVLSTPAIQAQVGSVVPPGEPYQVDTPGGWNGGGGGNDGGGGGDAGNDGGGGGIGSGSGYQ